VTAAAAFVEVFVEVFVLVVRDRGGNSTPQCAGVRFSFASARSHRRRASRRLHHLLLESEEETHAHNTAHG
jgi:hypothetical protein